MKNQSWLLLAGVVLCGCPNYPMQRRCPARTRLPRRPHLPRRPSAANRSPSPARSATRARRPLRRLPVPPPSPTAEPTIPLRPDVCGQYQTCGFDDRSRGEPGVVRNLRPALRMPRRQVPRAAGDLRLRRHRACRARPAHRRRERTSALRRDGLLHGQPPERGLSLRGHRYGPFGCLGLRPELRHRRGWSSTGTARRGRRCRSTGPTAPGGSGQPLRTTSGRRTAPTASRGGTASAGRRSSSPVGWRSPASPARVPKTSGSWARTARCTGTARPSAQRHAFRNEPLRADDLSSPKAVFTLSPDFAIAAGAGGCEKWNGASWTSFPCARGYAHLWASSSDDFWSVSRAGRSRCPCPTTAPTGWETLGPARAGTTTAGRDVPFASIWGYAKDDVWTNGGYRFDGSSWRKQCDRIELRSFWGTRADDQFGVQGNQIAHFDGERWTEARSLSRASRGRSAAIITERSGFSGPRGSSRPSRARRGAPRRARSARGVHGHLRDGGG